MSRPARERSEGTFPGPVVAIWWPVLVRLAKNPDPSLAGPALGTLGAMRMQSGNLDQALGFLDQARDQLKQIDWRGKGEVEANLGLVYLQRGAEMEGFRCLDEAERSFTRQEDRAQLRQCLENRARYLERTNRTEAARELRVRAAAVGEE